MSHRDSVTWVTPDWPAPATVRALTTLRTGGYSQGTFAGLNLATHVGDEAACVRRNRQLLREHARLPQEPLWLNQVHGVEVITASTHASTPPTADASVAVRSAQVCAVLTADCLPVLFCDLSGSCVAAAHAGWRGLVQGILHATVASLRCPADQLLAWLGPAIEPQAFEVGDEVRAQFLARDPACAGAFTRNRRERWQADLYQLARQDLARAGVTQVFGGGFECFADATRFFSYRREGQTGRMASLIWLQP